MLGHPAAVCLLDDHAGGKELFTKMHCALRSESLKIRNSNAIHHGEKFLAAIFKPSFDMIVTREI